MTNTTQFGMRVYARTRVFVAQSIPKFCEWVEWDPVNKVWIVPLHVVPNSIRFSGPRVKHWLTPGTLVVGKDNPQHALCLLGEGRWQESELFEASADVCDVAYPLVDQQQPIDGLITGHLWCAGETLSAGKHEVHREWLFLGTYTPRVVTSC